MGPDGYLAGDSKVVDAIEKFVLSLIAYEAAKAAPAASPERVKLTERADGVPELFVDFARSLFLDGETCAKTERRGHRGWITILYEEWPKLLRWMEAEIARRVAEAEAKLERARQQCNSLPTLTLERDAALAEVERLRAVLGRRDAQLIDTAKQRSELEARIAEQAAEIERLSRTVGVADVEQAYRMYCESHDIGPQAFAGAVDRLLRRERNAREAEKQRADKAEASLAELREFVRWWLAPCERFAPAKDSWFNEAFGYFSKRREAGEYDDAIERGEHREGRNT